MPILSVSGDSVVESSSFSPTLDFVVTLSEPAVNDVTLSYRVRSGTADLTDDFFEEIFTFTIPAGNTSATITIDVEDNDTEAEADESVILEIFNVQNAELANGEQLITATGFILDDDGAGVDRGVFVSDTRITEGDDGVQQAVFTIELSRSASSTLNFDFTTISGSAIAGEDFEATTGTVSFAPGSTQATVTVDIIGDTVVEGDQQFSLVLTPTAETAPAIGNGVDGAAGIATIVDDDAGFNVLPELSVFGATVPESDDFSPTLDFVVTLSEPAVNDVTLSYRVRSGTADLTDDFFEEIFTFTIPAGNTSATITINVEDSDSTAEADESVILEVFNVQNAVLSNGEQLLTATSIILDDDGAGVDRALLVSDARVTEGDSGNRQAVFEIQISEPSETELVFDFETVSASAVDGEDFVGQSGTVTFAPGQTIAAVIVDIIGDTIVEGDQQFSLVLTPTAETAPAIGNGVDGAAGIATIVDDDAGFNVLPELSVFGATVPESDDFSPTLDFVVTLSEPAVNDVTLSYRVRSGTADLTDDFFEEIFTFTIPAGNTSATITINVEDSDSTAEADESVILEVFNVQNAVLSNGEQLLTATSIILDDDGAGVDRALLVSDARVTEGDSGNRQAVFEIQISEPSETELVFDFETVSASAVDGEDFVGQSGTVTFAPGQTIAAVIVDIIGDTIVEGDQQFSLVLTPTAETAPAIGNGVDGAAGIATIVDDDAGFNVLPELSVFGATVPESDDFSPTLDFVVTLSEPALNDVTLSYRVRSGTADLDEDFFEEIFTFTIPAGNTSATITIDVQDNDTIAEADESVVLEIFNIQNAEAANGQEIISAIGFINDDDGGGTDRSVAVSEPIIVEGDSGESGLQFDILLSEPADETITINFTTASPNATTGVDFTGVSGAQDGVITFIPGQTLASVFVPVAPDNLVEASEIIQLILSAPQGGAVEGGASGQLATGIVVDDDAGGGVLPVVTVVPATVVESSSFSPELDFLVTLSSPATSDVVINYQTFDGTALGGTDFFDESLSIVIPAGSSSAIIRIGVQDSDTTPEPDETVGLRLTSVENGVFAGGATTLEVFGVIEDDDTGSPGLTVPLLQVADIEVEEVAGGTTAVFTIERVGSPSAAITGDFSVFAGTATAGLDFGASSGTFTILSGEFSTTVSVPILSDLDETEGDETFVLELSGLTNGRFAGGSDSLFAIGSIIDENDVLIGGAGNDTLDGGVGNDQIFGNEGDDVLLGGAGNDTLDGGVGDDQIFGNEGDDILLGGEGDDFLSGGTGSDTVDFSGASGGVTLELGRFMQVTGGAGNDTFVSIENAIGSAFDDEIRGSNAFNTLEGGAGNDELFGFGGQDTLIGGDGDDLLNSGGGDDTLEGGDGADNILAGFGEDLITGGAGNDTIDGGVGTDDISGNGGDDQIFAGSGFDVVNGGAGNDTILGQGGQDTLNGGDGDDTLNGNGLADELNGGAGNDQLFGGQGEDILNGGDGDDLLSGATEADILNGGAGNDTLNGGLAIDTLNGGTGNDVLNGGFGNDTLSGDEGNDQLLGGGGSDDLFGGDGDDTLNGQAGFDELTGGAGADQFIFSGADFDNDRITDFEDGVDLIVFRPNTGVTSLADITINDVAGPDVVLVTAAGNVRLENTNAADIDLSDFFFG